MTYAQPSDVSDRLGRSLSDEELTLVGTRLGDAENKIRRRVPDLDDQVTAGTIAEDDIVRIEAEAVLRLVRNPDGYLQENDGTYSYMLSQQAASGRLEILEDEWADLGVTVGGPIMLIPTFGAVQ
jgi:hypothetical protein